MRHTHAAKVAAWRLDLQDVCAEVPQCLGAAGTGQDAGEVDHSQAF